MVDMHPRSPMAHLHLNFWKLSLSHSQGEDERYHLSQPVVSEAEPGPERPAGPAGK